jgi:hypothetical protein
MSTLVVLATADAALADEWARQIPPGRTLLRLESEQFPGSVPASLGAVVVLDAAAENRLPPGFARCPTIYVGEPRSHPFEQAKQLGRARVYLSYAECAQRLREFLPLMEELAEKQSMLDLLEEKARRTEPARLLGRPLAGSDIELWDFLEGAIENIDSRDRLIAEFRRAARLILRASHAVFFLREADGFRADRGTSFFPPDDPIVAYFESHPAIVDGSHWEVGGDPRAELAVRSRLALWGARLLIPVHDNGRLLGLIALGVRNDGQAFDDSDRARAVFFARLLRHCLAKTVQWNRLTAVNDRLVIGAKYLPSTLVLGPNEAMPPQVPLVVRELIGQVRRSREACRAAPAEGQPFRAGAGLILETGGIWAFWQEASNEVHDAIAHQRLGRRGLLRELGLTLSHELGNALVSLATLRQLERNGPPPPPLLDAARSDIARLELLNRDLGLMQTLHECDPATVDLREVVKSIGIALGIPVEMGPEPVRLSIAKSLVEFSLRSLIASLVENRSGRDLAPLALQLDSAGEGADLTALLSIKGRQLELEGIYPEPADDSVPNQGRLGVFIAKEILRLHRGEIHAGPGQTGTEILISLRSC